MFFWFFQRTRLLVPGLVLGVGVVGIAPGCAGGVGAGTRLCQRLNLGVPHAKQAHRPFRHLSGLLAGSGKTFVAPEGLEAGGLWVS